MKVWLIVIGIVFLGVHTSATQDWASTACVSGADVPTDDRVCGSEDQYWLVWSCGDVLFIHLEVPMSVRFGRTARRAPARLLALVRSSAGRYFVVPGEELFKLLVETMPDGSISCARVTRVANHPVITRPDAHRDRPPE